MKCIQPDLNSVKTFATERSWGKKQITKFVPMGTGKLKRELHETETQNSDVSDYCAADPTDSSSKVFLISIFTFNFYAFLSSFVFYL